MADNDDWGTVSIKPAKKTGREIASLRQRYIQQREALGQFASDAPSDHLAREYMRVRGEVEAELAKLDALEESDPSLHSGPGVADAPASRAKPWFPDATQPMARGEGAGSESSERTRLFLIPLIGLLVLGLLGFFVWRSFNKREKATDLIVEAPAATITPIEPEVVEPPKPTSPLAITPASQEFGTIRRGTRATRQFELTNRSASLVTFKVARSSCRCVYYEHLDKLEPRGKSSLTVTVDGGRAKRGLIQETIEVRDKTSNQPLGSFGIVATIE